MAISRTIARRLAWTTAALLLAGTADAGTLRIRQNVKDIGAAGRQLFVDAVKELKKAGTNKGTTAINNRYDEYVQLHDTFCEHFNGAFLPWHRKMLWEFEEDVRALGGKFKDFTLPYWDSTMDDFPADLAMAGDNAFMGPNGNAAMMRTVTEGPFKKGDWVTLNEGSTNMAKDLERNFDDIGKLKTDGMATLPMAFAAADFKTMSELVEQGPGMHNDIHGRVGGHLGDVVSGSDDPVFFLLHAFIDLAWAKWQIDNKKVDAYDPFGMPFGNPAGVPKLNDALLPFGGGSMLGFNFTANDTVKDQLRFFDESTLGYNYMYKGALIIPEPSSLALAGVGLGGVLFAGATRRRRAA